MQYENKIPMIDIKFKFRAINLQAIRILRKDLNKKQLSALVV